MKQKNIKRVGILSGILVIFMTTSHIVLANSSSRKGYLGVCIEDLSKDERDELNVDHGILVTCVIEESPAEKCGILEDDIIQYFGGKKIRRSKDLIRYVRNSPPDTEVKIQLVRENEKKELTIKLGKYRLHKRHAFRNGDDKSVYFSWHGGAYLGVTLQELNRDLAPYFWVDENSGVLILEVEKDSPAEKADIKSGDILIKVDEESVTDPEKVQELLADFEKGDEIELKVIRHGKQKQFKVALGSRSRCFHIPFEENDRIDCFKDFRDFRIDLPHIEIDIPEIDIEYKNNKEWQEKMKRKMEDVENKIRDKIRTLKERMLI